MDLTDLEFFLEHRMDGQSVSDLEGVSDLVHGIATHIEKHPEPRDESDARAYYSAIGRVVVEAIDAALEGYRDDEITKMEGEA